MTLTGPGGVGKTRLALAASTEIAAEFRDGGAFVDLSAIREPDQVAPAIAQALGIRTAGDRPAMAAIALALHDQQTLLILDNFEQIVEAGPHITDLLRACNELKALVTSRSQLHLSGAHIYATAPLSQSDSVDLFNQRARAVRADFTLSGASVARASAAAPTASSRARNWAASLQLQPPQRQRQHPLRRHRLPPRPLPPNRRL